MQNLRDCFYSLFVSAGNSVTKSGQFFSGILTDLTHKVSLIAFKIIGQRHSETLIVKITQLSRSERQSKLTEFEQSEFSQNKNNFAQRILKNVLFALKSQNEQAKIKKSFAGHTKQCDVGIEKPITTKGDRFCGESSCRGLRKWMEDQVLVEPELMLKRNGQIQSCQLYGVFDGHGGASCAQFAKDNLANYLKQKIEQSSEWNDQIIYPAFKDVMVELNENFFNANRTMGIRNESGTTVLCALVIGEHVWVANVGDSRAILVDSFGQVVQASHDAKPNDVRFLKGITKKGGKVYEGRIEGQLAMGRALGDRNVNADNGSYVVPNKPKITKYNLADFEGGHLVLACDGIWDVATSEQVGEFVHQQSQAGCDVAQISKQIVATAFKAGSQDNLTALVVKL